MISIELTEFRKAAEIGFGRASIPGTCGELMQGTLGGVDFLINSPIPYFADIRVHLTGHREIRVTTPGNFLKVERAVRAVLDMSGFSRWGAVIEVLGSIPRGKGLASSTAEITAAIVATSIALNELPWKDEYVEIVLAIDRSTDAVYAPGVVNCSFLTGGIIESFRRPPRLSFVVVDSGGEVETLAFNREKARSISRMNGLRLYDAYKAMRLGLKTGNAALVAHAATESTLINQQVLPKELLGTLLAGTREYGALGINCAHTGTVLGVMFDSDKTDQAMLSKRVSQLVGEEKVLGVYRLISGRTH